MHLLTFDTKLNPMLISMTISHSYHLINTIFYLQEPKTGEHYDTPRKIKECLAEAVRKPCGCILRVKQPEPERPCVCQRLLSCWNTTQQDDVHALYATVDMSKKCNRAHNYANIETTVTPPTIIASNNYANIDFAQSLDLYENARQVAQMANSSTSEMCTKCGHVQNDYLMMEPAARKPHPPPGYLPMSPAVKQRLGKVISNSNPNLIAPAVDRSGKPSGSAMLHANVYQRKQLMDSADNLDKHRRRSNSADSTRCEEVENPSPCHCGQTVVRR